MLLLPYQVLLMILPYFLNLKKVVMLLKKK